MDDVLEVAEVLTDIGLEEAFAWLLRLVGLVLVLAGLGLWFFTDAGLLVLPAALIVLGTVLLVVPSVLLDLIELFV